MSQSALVEKLASEIFRYNKTKMILIIRLISAIFVAQAIFQGSRSGVIYEYISCVHLKGQHEFIECNHKFPVS